MRLDDEYEITVVSKPQWDREKTHFTWLDEDTLALDAVIANPKCGAVSKSDPDTQKWDHLAILTNDIQGVPDQESGHVHCISDVPFLEVPIESLYFDKVGAGATFELELYQVLVTTLQRELIDTLSDLKVPEFTKPEIPKVEITFQVPNHSNVEIRSGDNLIELYHEPYTCELTEAEDYLFHIRTEGSLKHLADVRLRPTEGGGVECVELDSDPIWCGRLEAPGVSVSAGNIVTVYIGVAVETKEDVLAKLTARGFIPFTQHPTVQTGGGGWTRTEGEVEATYKKEWGNTSFGMWVSGEEGNPPTSTNSISWVYTDIIRERACNATDPPGTGSCRLTAPATALLDSAIDELYIGFPETVTARIIDTVPSADISVATGEQFPCAIEVTNWSWIRGKVRARITASGKGTTPWERSEEATVESMDGLTFNDNITMGDVKYQLDFYAEHYDDDSASWIIDDMKRVTVATKTTALLTVNKAVDRNGVALRDQEALSVLWDGGDCSMHPPAEIIVGSGYYCDDAKRVETALGHHIVTVKGEGYITVREDFNNIIAGEDYVFTPIMLREGEGEEEVEMGSISDFHAMIAVKEAAINTFCNESAGTDARIDERGICACSDTGSQDESRWCKNPGLWDTIEEQSWRPHFIPLSKELPTQPRFDVWCGDYPTPDSTLEYIGEWWSRAIELAFSHYLLCVQSKSDYFEFIPAVVRQVQYKDKVVVSESKLGDYDSPSPRLVYFPREIGNCAEQVGDHQLYGILMTSDESGEAVQTYIGPFWYLKEDLTEGGRQPALLYRDWHIDGKQGVGGAIELTHWDVSNPPDESDIIFTEFFDEHSVTELPLSMLEEAVDSLPFMTGDSYATLQLMKPIDTATGDTLGSADVWWDDCECGGYTTAWEKEIGPGKTLGGKDCLTDFGPHLITIKRSGYSDFSTLVNFKPGNEYPVEPMLAPKAGGGDGGKYKAIFKINAPRRLGTKWYKEAKIFIGIASASLWNIQDTGKTVWEEPVKIEFCRGCKFGTKCNEQPTELGSVYDIVLTAHGMKDINYVFNAHGGAERTVSPIFESTYYGGATYIKPGKVPEIFVDKRVDFFVELVNTGNVDTNYIVDLIFTGIDTGDVYHYESEIVNIPENEEATVVVPLTIPIDAIPEGKDIANFDIDIDVWA